MKKNIIILILFYFICIFSNCSDKKQVGIEYEILNQNFISIVDTIAYDYNSLRPEPNNIPLKKRKSEYSITVFDKFIDIKVWENTIKEALKNCTNNEHKKYLSLFMKSQKNVQSNIEFSNLKQVGLFKLYPTNDSALMRKSGFIGHIKFSKILYDRQIGLMVVSLHDNIKSGIEKLILFEKTDDKWIIKKEIELVIW